MQQDESPAQRLALAVLELPVVPTELAKLAREVLRLERPLTELGPEDRWARTRATGGGE